MRWQSARRSENVENRGRGGGMVIAGGGGTLVLALVVFLMGGDPTALLMNGMSQSSTLSSSQQAEQEDFVKAVLGNTEDVWTKQFKMSGKTYVDPGLVLFADAVDSACGYTGSAVGPFYCPLDQKIYLDLSFFQELENDLNAPGDFARAYVIAHEVGHHVQRLLGTEENARRKMQRLSRTQANAISVKLELQADCYAGVWAHDAGQDYNLLESGDAEEALKAASRIGDDALQTKAQGYAVPDSFTHGTSAQRFNAFKQGFLKGSYQGCSSFNP
jgi:predicted metalloprotease